MAREAQAKRLVGRWLAKRGLGAYDESPTPAEPDWGRFQVRGVPTGKRPDLVVKGAMEAAGILQEAYVAIEIKPGSKHHDILDGFDAVLDYFGDCLWGARYSLDGQEIPLFAIVLATAFSPSGYLFEAEGKFDPTDIVLGPWDAHPMTFTIARLLWRQGDNALKRYRALVGLPRAERRFGSGAAGQKFPEVGVLVREPGQRERVLLMLSAPPYHWCLVGVVLLR